MRKRIQQCFIFLFVLSVFSSQFVHMAWSQSLDSTYGTNYILYGGPEVTFNLTSENNYSDSIMLYGSSGITTVTCKLAGGVAGVDRLYGVIIFWNGTNNVQSIKASNLSITNGSVLKSRTFYSKGFLIDGLSSNVGSSEVGVCNIPSGVNKVMVKTKGLQAFFYDRDFWISTGELYGSIRL